MRSNWSSIHLNMGSVRHDVISHSISTHSDEDIDWVMKMSMTWSNVAGFEYSGLMRHVVDVTE